MRIARPPDVSGVPASSASAARSIRISARPVTVGRRAHGAHRLVAGENGVACFRRRAVKHNPNRARARGAAMLHPRHHLLADITALVEIDAVQPVHVGLVRERVAIDEIETAARNARGDAMGVIGGAVDQLRADQIGGFLCEFLWHQNPPAERWRCADRRR